MEDKYTKTLAWIITTVVKYEFDSEGEMVVLPPEK